jgi:hypothetical protein
MVTHREYPTALGIVLIIINIILGFIEFVVGARVILELFGASVSASFVQWIYNISAPFVSPFFGIFPNRVVDGEFYVDLAGIFAFIVYAVVAYIINAVFNNYLLAGNDTGIRRDDYLK